MERRLPSPHAMMIWLRLAACGAWLAATGCAHMSHSQEAALVGGGVGAMVGSLVGGHSGNAGAGAAIGAATGALAGGVLGHARDMEVQRDVAFHHAAHVEHVRHVRARALGNGDVIELTRNGLDDGVILAAMQSRGGRFDTSPPALISLRQNGVSNHVIQAMLRQEGGP